MEPVRYPDEICVPSVGVYGGYLKSFCELYVGRGLFFFNGLAEGECESFVPVVTNNY